MKIQVVDWYEGTREIIGTAYSMSEAAAIRNARIEDTDGECDVECYIEQYSKPPKKITHLVTMYSPNAHY